MRGVLVFLALLLLANPAAAQDAKTKLAMVDVKTLEKAVSVHNLKNGTFPKNLDVLTKEDDLGNPPILQPKALLDPWKRPYQYDSAKLTKKGIPFIWSEGPPPHQFQDFIGNWEPGEKQPTIYDRLGGEKGITQIVDDIFAFVIADPKIRKVHKDHFKMGDVAGLKRKLIDQIGEATGGPQKYKGKNMKDAHKGMKITNEDFNALMDDITKALVKNKVQPKDLRILLKALQSMRKDVVEVKDKTSWLPQTAPSLCVSRMDILINH